jgi:poly-gamma-glutamate synthesis protein (capsule biosynthesis protein)
VLVALAAVIVLLVLTAACGGNTTATPTATQPASTAVLTPIPTPDREVTIAAVGDVMLDRDVEVLMTEHGPGYPFEHVAALLQDADVTIANLEVALTERGDPVEKLFNFRTLGRFAIGLPEAGIDVVALGNNHIADYGARGVEDTLAALEGVGLLHSGAGMNEDEARRPAVIEAEGLRIAFLSYTDQFINTFAGPGQAGVAFADVASITADVIDARDFVDIVVVSLHSGREYLDDPTPAQVELSHAAIDAGALLVLGHHPHTLQGIEEYHGGLIAYSLGNFVFDLDAGDLESLGPRAFETVVLYVTLREDEVVGVRMEPVFIDVAENRPRPATEEEAEAILGRVNALNDLVGVR